MRNTPGRPSIIILEPYLHASSGHQFHSVLEISRAVAPIEPILVVSASVANLPFPPQLRVLPLFRSNVNEFFNIGPLPASGMRRTLRKMVKSVNRRIRKVQVFARDRFQIEFTEWPEMRDVVQKSGCADADHIVIPTAIPSVIVELRAALRKVATDPGPHIHVRFMVGDGPKLARPLRTLFSSMVAEPGQFDRLHVYVETPAMQRHLLGQYGVHADLFPHVLNAPAHAPSVAAAPAKPITFALLGAPRAEKGTGRLIAIMESLAADPTFPTEDVVLIAQLDHSTKRKRAVSQPIIATAKKLGMVLETVPTGISSEQYEALLARADCLILPYTSPRYRLSGSGVVFEALARGKPFICSAGLAFSDYAHGGMIEAEDDEAFAQAMKRFVANPQPFRVASLRAAQEYLDAQRLGPFLTRVQSVRVDKEV
jgi:glycosyltransferase involved in cell wall biosynthesis